MIGVVASVIGLLLGFLLARGLNALFDAVGFAGEDFSALRYVRDLTRQDRREIDLVPALDDPKDLFGLVSEPVAIPIERAATAHR